MIPLLILDKMKSWALTALAVLLVLVGAYAMGGRASKKSAEKKRNYDEALRSAAGSKGVHDAEMETRRLPTGGAADELSRDWMRESGDRPDAGTKGNRGDST